MRTRLLLSTSVLALALLALGACTSPATDTGTAGPSPALPGGLPDLDYSCRVDSDCEVKNVGNCCGYFPACVNRAAQPDPQAVMAHCAETGMASICGFREIQACSCVDRRCQAAGAALVPQERE